MYLKLSRYAVWIALWITCSVAHNRKSLRRQHQSDSRLVEARPEHAKVDEKTKIKHKYGPQAGISNFNDTNPFRNLLVNGEDVSPRDYPFFGLSDIDEAHPNFSIKLCGGTLIHSDFFLTAAHCQGAFIYGVNLYDPASETLTREVQIVSQYRYPDFNLDNGNINFDVLLLQLADPIYDIDPIPLDDGSSSPVVGDELNALGRGFTSYQGNQSNNLQKATFEYIDNDTCQQRSGFGNIDYGEDLLCVDTVDDSSICQGDSGGPLISEAAGVQVGVISFTFQCQPDTVPDGSARVSFFYDWIQQKICDFSNDAPAGCTPSPSPSPNAVEMVLYFRHDYFPEETTYAVRDQNGGSIEFTGPTYVPGRGETWDTRFWLLPGQYTFEVYDSFGDGLMSGNNPAENGAWELYAIYDTENMVEERVGSGGAVFGKVQSRAFQVNQAIQGSNTSQPVTSPTEPPTPVPSPPPSPLPTKAPTPTPAPSPSPTTLPTKAPTPAPSPSPTPLPTMLPTPLPTIPPTPLPTNLPTPPPSLPPTPLPTKLQTPIPSPPPTPVPTGFPTVSPSHNPSIIPSYAPTKSPTPVPTPAATSSPTVQPVLPPTLSPTNTATPAPTMFPTPLPTTPAPTWPPTAQPSASPTIPPSGSPTWNPTTVSPTPDPTTRPTKVPTPFPSMRPSLSPTTLEPSTKLPSMQPSQRPTTVPATALSATSPPELPSSVPSQAPQLPTPAPINPTTTSPVSDSVTTSNLPANNLVLRSGARESSCVKSWIFLVLAGITVGLL